MAAALSVLVTDSRFIDPQAIGGTNESKRVTRADRRRCRISQIPDLHRTRGRLDARPAHRRVTEARSRQLCISSPLVWKLHGKAMAKAVPKTETILLPDGEKFKQLQPLARIYESLIKLEADRGAGIIAVGGGVIGDMAGFVAATYLRGITLVQVPTTLLAQVDSAIGGKVGVNHALGKNLIGAFHQPSLVVIDPALLETLPRREFRAGLYEVIKYGMTSSRDLFERIDREIDAIFARKPKHSFPSSASRARSRPMSSASTSANPAHAPDAELRPHRRPCARGRDEIQTVPSWRGDRAMACSSPPKSPSRAV